MDLGDKWYIGDKTLSVFGVWYYSPKKQNLTYTRTSDPNSVTVYLPTKMLEEGKWVITPSSTSPRYHR